MTIALEQFNHNLKSEVKDLNSKVFSLDLVSTRNITWH